METEPLQIRLAVRELVEFVLRRGSIDSRFSGFDRANEGSRIHRKLQKAAGDSYKAEVPFKAERTVGDVCYTLEGRADGVITEPDGHFTIDEIKTTGAPAELLTADFNPYTGRRLNATARSCVRGKPAWRGHPNHILSGRHG